MNLIDRDKLLYELSCAVLSECSQDDYEHIEEIINEQPIICKLNNDIYNEDKDLMCQSNKISIANWKYHYWDTYRNKDIYICSNCKNTIETDCEENIVPMQLGYRYCPYCGAKIIDDNGI